MWIGAEEALARLGVKPQTLYASVSRGRIRAKPDPRDPRRSLYRAADVERLAARSGGRRAAEAVAAETIRWGEPVLSSAITAIVDGQLFYRGQSATDLARHATLEEAAQLLWDAPAVPDFGGGAAAAGPFSALAGLAEVALTTLGRNAAALRSDAARVVSALAGAVAVEGHDLAHRRLADHWQAPEAAEPLRTALVLLADHELNASTFAARVAVSTGASLAAGALAGLAALSGPRHGTASTAVRRLAARSTEIGAGAAVREVLAETAALPAVGHPLYPEGDPRAGTLLESFTAPPSYKELRLAIEEASGEAANIDFALAALADAFDLPSGAPLDIFALARCVGWLAHMLEQLETGELIRPRARYIGISPVT